MFKVKKDPRIVAAVAFFAPAILAPALTKAAGVSYDGVTNYTQNFDNLLTTVPANNTTVAASTVLPSGWSLAESGANANAGIRVDPGSSTTGDSFLWGATSSNERALGSYASGSLTAVYGVELVNTSGGTLNSFTLTYTGEQWKDGGNGSAVLNSLTFDYSVGATSITTGTYTGVSQLNFTALVNNTTADVATDGNAANRRTTLTFTVNGLTWNAGQSLFLRWSDINDAGNDDGLGIDDLTFSAAANPVAASVVWAAASGTWDNAAANWTGGSPTAGTFKANDAARFDNTATGGVITIAAAGVAPTLTVVDNDASHPYTFTSSGSAGITSGMLVKTGVGTLTLQSVNTYTGGTSINGGTLIVSDNNQLGGTSGGLFLGGGELKTAAAIISTRGVALAASTSSTFNTNGFASSAGAIAGAGTLNVNGGGALTTSSIAGASSVAVGTNTALTATSAYTQTTGTLSVATDGALTFDYAGPARTTLLAGTVDGAIAFKTGTPRVDFNTGTLSGSGEVQIHQTGTLLSNSSGVAGGTVNLKLELNASNAAFTKGDVTAGTYVPGTFITTIGGTKLATEGNDNLLTFGGVISGDSDVNFANNSSTGGGSGWTQLNAANTYTGVTSFNMNGSAVRLGVNNALPTGTDVIFGTQSGVGSPVLDLFGNNLQIGSLSHGSQGTPGQFKITNLGSADSILTISGSTSPANAFGGVISDGPTNKVILVKGGSNTITLAGVNTYTGDTTVNDGVLKVTGSIANSAHVNVHGGMLQVDNSSALGEGTDLFVDGSGMVNLNFAGSFTVGQVFIDGVLYESGTFDSSNSHFAGDGSLTATPEPASLSLVGLGACGLLARRRRRKA